MKKKQIIIISVLALVSIAAIIVSLVLLRKPQTYINRATGPSCPANGASCTWTSDDTAKAFKVEVIDLTNGQSIFTTTTTEKIVHFTPVVDHPYKCVVTPVNDCGDGPSGSGISTCVPNPSDTPIPSPTPTAAPSPSVTPTPTTVVCQQPSSCKTQEQCTTEGGTTNGEQCSEAGTVCCVPPNTTPTNTPVPSSTPVPTATSTPEPSHTPVPTNTPIPTVTDSPTPPLTSTPVPTATGTPVPTSTSAPTFTPYPTYTPFPTGTLYPTSTPYPTATHAATPTPTEIIIAVNNTNTPTPQGTAAPTVPAAGVPMAWFIVLIPVVLVAVGFIF